MALDGVVADLADPIEKDAKIEFLTREDPRALELIRHDAAHVHGRSGAGAVARHPGDHRPGDRQRLLSTTSTATQPFTPEDLPVDREEDARDHRAATNPSPRRCGRATRPSACSSDKGENFKVELVDAIPPGEQLKIYRQGDWFDLCRGPHMTSTGKIGNAFKLQKVAGAYWRGDSNNPMLTRIYGTAFAKQDELDAYLQQLEEAEKRDHRKLGREMDLFHFQEEGPGTVFWHANGWTIFQEIVAYMRRRLQGRLSARSTRRSCSTSRCGRPPATGAGSARTCSWRSRPATTPRTSASSPSSR